MPLLVSERPSNLRLGMLSVTPVDSDVFNICERVKEIDPALVIYLLEQPRTLGGVEYPFAVGELCADGVERFVCYADALDARLITKLQRMLRIPAAERLEVAMREADKDAEAARELELDTLVETLGMPMRTQMWHDGFSEPIRSYAKRGVSGGRGSRRRAA